MCKVFFNETCAATFSSYIYSAPPAKKSKISVPKVEVLKKAQTAQIELLIQEQNCGFLNFQGEKLFFHGSQMIGNIVQELEVGDVMNFDVVYNPRTSKFLAKNVRRVESVKTKKNLGHFQMMQVTETNKVSHLENNNKSELCQGKITKISAQHGFIDNEVFFHYSNLVGTHMSELEVGTCLSFKARMNKSNTRKIAEDVQKVEEKSEEKVQTSPVIICTPEIQSIKNILALEGANLLRRLSKNLVVNEQNCDLEVENIMQNLKVDALGAAGRKNSLTPSFTDSLRTSRRGSAIGFR
jgi:cold shock CspA family protein